MPVRRADATSTSGSDGPRGTEPADAGPTGALASAAGLLPGGRPGAAAPGVDIEAWFAQLPQPAALRRGEHLRPNASAARLLGHALDAADTVDGWIALLDLGPRRSHRFVSAHKDGFLGGSMVPVLRADGSRCVLECFGLRFGDCEIWLLHDVTQRQHVQQQLRMTRQALDGVGMIHCVIGRDGRLVDANDFALRRLGYAREQMPSLHAREIDLHLDDQREQATRQALIAGGVVHLESEYRCADGSCFPVAITLCSGRGADGAPVAMVLARDLTDERRREYERLEALARDEEQARLLSELAVHRSMVAGDVEALCRDVVRRALPALGVDRAGVWLIDPAQARLLPRALHAAAGIAVPRPEGIPTAALADYLGLLGRGEILAVEDTRSDERTPHLHDGAREGAARALLDAPLLLSGQLVGVVCLEQLRGPRQWSAEEIGFARALGQLVAQAMLSQQRLRDMDALRASEARHARAQRAAGFGSWELNLVTDEPWWSGEMYRLFEVDPGSFVPHRRGFQALVHPEDLPRVIAAFDDAIASGARRLQVEYRIPLAGGGERTILDTGVVERDAQGTPLKVTGTALDITERRRQEQHIHRLAFYDALTGLPNRRLLEERVGHCIRDARANGTCFALLFLDLDRFKKINDSRGHSHGDRVLTQVAARLLECVRPRDTVARLGGDEFVVLLPQVQVPGQAAQVGERLLEALRGPFSVCEDEVELSVSIGLSCYPHDGTDTETLIRNADTAMYAAKDEGRDAMRFFSGDMNREALRRLTVEAGLRRALEREEFELYLQPCYSVEGEQVVGCEALLRWRHPERGLLAPAEFLEVAEHSGLIVPIGSWVLRAACGLLQRWHSAGLRSLPVCVNLSALQLRRGDIAAEVEALLAEYGVAPGLLCLEITETVLMERLDTVVPKLQRLGALGVQLAVDDFGTGYSSLNYLRQLPLDVLKVDRSFVATVDRDDPASMVITSTVIELARRLGLTVIAEGVETQAQLDYLRREQCDAFQGFLRSRPIPAAEFALQCLKPAIAAPVAADPAEDLA